MKLKQIFEPPFFNCAYGTSMWDNKGIMMYDYIGKNLDILRVRGWGYLISLHTVNAADVQDRIIQFTIDTLNKHYTALNTGADDNEIFYAQGGDILKLDGTGLTEQQKKEIPGILSKAWEELNE